MSSQQITSDKNKKTFFSNAFFNGTADMSLLVAGFLQSVLLSRIVGPETWGTYSQVVWLVSFSSVLFSFGFTYTSIRYIPFLMHGDLKKLLKPFIVIIIFVQLLIVILGACGVFIFGQDLINRMGWVIDVDLIKLSSINIISNTILQLSVSILRGLQKYKSISLVSILLSILSVLVLFVSLINPSIRFLILIMTLGQILILPFVLTKIWKTTKQFSMDRKDFFHSGLWKQVGQYTLLVFITALVDQIVWQRSEIFFLGALADSRQSGFYSLAFTITQVTICTLPSAITGTLTPEFSALHQEGSSNKLRELYSRVVSYISFIVLPLSAFLLLVAPYLIVKLYGEDFSPAISVIRILTFSSLLGIFARPSASVLHSLNKPKVLLFGSLIALPVDLFLAWLLIPEFAAQGAAYANLTTQFVGAVIAVGYVTFSIKPKLDWVSIQKMLFSTLTFGMAGVFILNLGLGSVLTVLLISLCGMFIYPLLLILLKDTTTLEIVHIVIDLIPPYFQKFFNGFARSDS